MNCPKCHYRMIKRACGFYCPVCDHNEETSPSPPPAAAPGEPQAAFTDWLSREDYGDREQLQRCWEKAQEAMFDGSTLTVNILRLWEPERIKRFALHLLGDAAQADAVELSRLRAELEAAKGKRANACSGCGGPHPFDTSIPSAVWNQVVRAQGLPDYLCLTCIVGVFAESGRGFTATMWSPTFNGTPIEVIINGQTAQDAVIVSDENTELRVALSTAQAALAAMTAERDEMIESVQMMGVDLKWYRQQWQEVTARLRQCQAALEMARPVVAWQAYLRGAREELPRPRALTKAQVVASLAAITAALAPGAPVSDALTRIKALRTELKKLKAKSEDERACQSDPLDKRWFMGRIITLNEVIALVSDIAGSVQPSPAPRSREEGNDGG